MTHKAFLTGTIFYILTLTFVYTQSDVITIPFRTVKRTIIVEGKVDGRPGYFILDTGIAKTLLNQAHFQNMHTFTNKEYSGFQSINNTSQNTGIGLIYLQMQDFSVKVSTNVIDLRHIEREKGLNILGVVGIDIFRKYELEIDFFTKEIRLYRLDKRRNRRLQEPQPIPSTTLSFQYQGHLPCIAVYLSGIPLQLGLDTGAEYNLLSENLLSYGGNEIQMKQLLDLNGKYITAPSTQIAGLEAGSIEMQPMPAIFVALNKHYGGLDSKKIQGLLGFDFFRQHRTAINFKKREVYLWDAQAKENAPLAKKRN